MEERIHEAAMGHHDHVVSRSEAFLQHGSDVLAPQDHRVDGGIAVLPAVVRDTGGEHGVWEALLQFYTPETPMFHQREFPEFGPYLDRLSTQRVRNHARRGEGADQWTTHDVWLAGFRWRRGYMSAQPFLVLPLRHRPHVPGSQSLGRQARLLLAQWGERTIRTEVVGRTLGQTVPMTDD
jgi:hypothetical protein